MYHPSRLHILNKKRDRNGGWWLFFFIIYPKKEIEFDRI